MTDDKLRLGDGPAQWAGRQRKPYAATFENEAELGAYLDQLCAYGYLPELATIDANGRAYLATMLADSDNVHHIVTGEDGRAHRCEAECAEWSPCAWRPRYPVIALSEFPPSLVRAEIAKASDRDRRAELLKQVKP